MSYMNRCTYNVWNHCPIACLCEAVSDSIVRPTDRWVYAFPMYFLLSVVSHGFALVFKHGLRIRIQYTIVEEGSHDIITCWLKMDAKRHITNPLYTKLEWQVSVVRQPLHCTKLNYLPQAKHDRCVDKNQCRTGAFNLTESKRKTPCMNLIKNLNVSSYTETPWMWKSKSK